MNFRKILKWFLITTGVLSIALVIFVTFFLKGILVNKLTRELKHTFGNYYTLKYSSIETSVGLNGLTITIQKPTFTSDTSLHELNEKFPALFFKSNVLKIDNISVYKLLFTHDIELKQILLKKPSLKLVTFTRDTTELKEEPASKKKSEKNLTNFLYIKKISIEKGNVVTCNAGDKTDTTFLGINIGVNVENIAVHTSKLKSLAYALEDKNNFQFSVEKAYYKPYQANYLFFMDSLELDDRTKTISAHNLSESTLKSKHEISQKSRFSKVIAETKIGYFKASGYNKKQFFLYNTIRLHSMQLEKIDLELFRNKRKQLDVNNEKMALQEMLTGFPFSLVIDTIRIKNFNLTFELIDHRTKTPVEFSLDGINILLANINTIPGTRDTMVLLCNGKFMNAAAFKMNLFFPDIHKADSYYNGYIGPMPFLTFNPILASYSGIQVVSGQIQSVVFSGRCNKYENFGSLVFTYKDLEIEVNKKSDNGEKKKGKLVTMLGNMLLNRNNPVSDDEAPRKQTYYFKREKYQSDIVLWIGGIMEGVKNTLVDKDVQEKGKTFMKNKKKRDKKTALSKAEK
ncbi:MAG TPA: hypothetical protein VK177_19830 [Flavobacteriales bacterium]|nr:hypothetical protein [Flavobacteriales bacterium]